MTQREVRARRVNPPKTARLMSQTKTVLGREIRRLMDVSYGRRLKDTEASILIRYTKLVYEMEALEKLGGGVTSAQPNSYPKRPKGETNGQ